MQPCFALMLQSGDENLLRAALEASVPRNCYQRVGVVDRICDVTMLQYCNRGEEGSDAYLNAPAADFYRMTALLNYFLQTHSTY